MTKFNIELTDTFAGEANYSWVRRASVSMPELTHYGYDGATNYAKANRSFERELVRKAKAAVGLTGIRGRTEHHGDSAVFHPYGLLQVLFITWTE